MSRSGRPGEVAGSKTWKRMPSKRARPLCVAIQRKPSLVCVIAWTEFCGRPESAFQARCPSGGAEGGSAAGPAAVAGAVAASAKRRQAAGPRRRIADERTPRFSRCRGAPDGTGKKGPGLPGLVPVFPEIVPGGRRAPGPGDGDPPPSGEAAREGLVAGDESLQPRERLDLARSGRDLESFLAGPAHRAVESVRARGRRQAGDRPFRVGARAAGRLADLGDTLESGCAALLRGERHA